MTRGFQTLNLMLDILFVPRKETPKLGCNVLKISGLNIFLHYFYPFSITNWQSSTYISCVGKWLIINNLEQFWQTITKTLILRAFYLLTLLNCSLLFQVILAIFVPYFYPGANFGVNFRGLDRRLWCKRETQWECTKMSPLVQCETQWDTVRLAVAQGKHCHRKRNGLAAYA